jgi:hypothetical protein
MAPPVTLTSRAQPLAGAELAEPIKPVAKVVYVCDDIVRDPDTGKIGLLNLWDSVQVPAGESFPFRLPKVSVFVWWRDGYGRVRTRIDIVEAATGNVVRRTRDGMLDFGARSTSVFARYKLNNCIFAEAGYYYIELYCQNDFVDDQVIRVLPPEE